MLLGLCSAIFSIIIEVKFFDSKVIWQSLLGVAWTIASLLIMLFGLIGIYNTINIKESTQKRKYYINSDGKQKSFRNKEKYLKLEDIKQFFLTTSTPEKICILSESNIYCTFEVYMEPENPNLRAQFSKFDINTRQFYVDETNYIDIDEAIEYLKNNQFVLKDGIICVIDYEFSSPYHLQKRIEDEK